MDRLSTPLQPSLCPLYSTHEGCSQLEGKLQEKHKKLLSTYQGQ